MTNHRWVLGEDATGERFELLCAALASCGYAVGKSWSYAALSEPFNAVPFVNYDSEIVVRCDQPEGIVIEGPSRAVESLRLAYDRLPNT